MCRVIYVVLHPTPYTLHPTPYTLHPTSHICVRLLAAAASCRGLAGACVWPQPWRCCCYQLQEPAPYTLHSAPYTLHPAQPNHAPHPTPCTSHPAPRTLHPTPTPTESSGTRGEICNGSYLDEEKIPVFIFCPRLQGLSLFLLSLSLSLSVSPSLRPSLYK